MVVTPIAAAGAPPRNTIASTSARKLPEIRMRPRTESASKSLATDRTSSENSRPTFQCAVGALRTPITAAAQSNPISATTNDGLGRLTNLNLAHATAKVAETIRYAPPPRWSRRKG
jgi:hypothetical protein